MIKKLPIFLTALTLSLFFIFSIVKPSTSLAQSGFLTVAPARQIVEIDPGDTTSISIKFLNQGVLPIAGDIGVADFLVIDNMGTVAFQDLPKMQAPSPYAAASWVKIPTGYEKVTISAEDKVTITLKMTVPEDAKPGGRYFGVYFEPNSSIPTPIKSDKEAGTSVKSRLAGLVYVRVAGPISENASIIKFQTPTFIEYGPVKVTSEIINRGSYHITPKGQVVLYDWLGRRIDVKALEETNIFPDSSRIFTSEMGKQLMFGKFKVELTATYGETGQVLTASASFFAFPIRVALVILLSIIILILVGMIIWKKVKGRQSKLELKLEEEIHELEELKDKVSDNIPQVKK
ncbi:hypothetical protein A2W13_00025 [Candidatus Woesebacteria bacterium RBG_16_36_11]|uniref:Uncharacterized protein n=2 Tax=Candidatus Woeseibacteriota TaxID=1752722 RepID=A0A1F7XAL2_9BACT|nr:MAG: hypothetical protein A2W13_00025 [Candidatus Woesebacteria bacterium RBG_16_36_11]OGM16079.1 MAG: hypothetical protein A2V55_01895 [Candidatus Woesebacteria bacterium RBG_19FT_COMBO_37_29]